MIQLYAFATPNGQKISIALEEMGLDYKFHKVDILKGQQHSEEFLKLNPNGKIPALVDGDLTIFESVAILIYLAEKTGKFMPQDKAGRFATLQWCMFQVSGIGPNFGQYGHFLRAPEKIPYALERFSNEVQRLFKVMDTQLEKNKYLAGSDYTIADMATWPWLDGYQKFYKQEIDAQKYPHVIRWFQEVGARPAVARGVKALL